MASEYIKYLLRDVEPEEAPPELTSKEKLKNWLYYHKWHLVIGAVFVGTVLDLGISSISQKKNLPDYEVAYVGSVVLPEDTQKALSDAFSAFGEDASGNGQVRTEIHTYLKAGGGETSAEIQEAAAAAEIRLIGDMENCSSYFYIVEDPDDFQIDFQVLADKNGNFPASTPCYAIPLAECPAFSDVMNGTYCEIVSGQEVSGKNADFLGGLYLARRAFAADRVCTNKEACDLLWEKLCTNNTSR